MPTATGYRPQAIGQLPRATGYRPTATGHKPTATSQLPRAAGYRQCHRLAKPSCKKGGQPLSSHTSAYPGDTAPSSQLSIMLLEHVHFLYLLTTAPTPQLSVILLEHVHFLGPLSGLGEGCLFPFVHPDICTYLAHASHCLRNAMRL